MSKEARNEEIREKRKAGMKLQEIADEYGLKTSAIRHIVTYSPKPPLTPEEKKERKERQREQQRQWYYENKEQEKERQKKYYQENLDYVKEKHNEYRKSPEGMTNRKKYVEENKEKLAAYRREYAKENSERISAYQKEYAQKNKERLSEYRREYYSKKEDDQPRKIKVRKISRPQIATSDYMKMLTKDYNQGMSLDAVAKHHGISVTKARKMLLTAGVTLKSPLTTEINRLYSKGMTDDKIAAKLNMTIKAVNQHLPYTRGEYNSDNPTKNAITIRRLRANKKEE